MKKLSETEQKLVDGIINNLDSKLGEENRKKALCRIGVCIFTSISEGTAQGYNSARQFMELVEYPINNFTTKPHEQQLLLLAVLDRVSDLLKAEVKHSNARRNIHVVPSV